MKGNNTLELNQATMIEALQLWVDATFKVGVKVLTVAASTKKGSSYSTENCFEVCMTDPDISALQSAANTKT